MKHISKICLSFAIVVCCLIGIAVNAQAATIVDSGTCGKNLTWELDSAGTLTISGTGDMKDHNYYNKLWHNYSDDIKSVVIKSGVTSIGAEAFYGCSNLTSVTIPASVTTIGNRAFASCDSLKAFTIPKNVTAISGGMFSNCDLLSSVTIHENVTSIGDSAFSACDALTSITIPASVTHIGGNITLHCPALKQIKVNKNNPCYSSDASGVLFDKNKTVLLQAPGSLTGSYVIPESVKIIVPHAFEQCNNLTAVTIPSNVDTIGAMAFMSCEKLETVTIEDGVKHINSSAFGFCGSLKTISIPESIESVGSGVLGDADFRSSLEYTIYKNAKYLGNENNPYMVLIGCTDKNIKTCQIHPNTIFISGRAFSGCTNLTTVTIPSKVREIGDYAFYNCENLTSVSLPNSIESFGWDVFANCSKIKYTKYDNAMYLGNDSNPHLVLVNAVSEDIKACKIHSKTKAIASHAFISCKKLTAITIPNSVVTIGDCSFSHCESLSSVTMGTGVTTIQSSAFGDCTALKSITLGDNVTYIGQYAFRDASNLSSITLPDKLETIAHGAFINCNLDAVTIPANVKSIDYEAFVGDNGPAKIIFAGDIPYIDNSAFGRCTATAYYPAKNTVWTKYTLKNYGGTLTWIGYNELLSIKTQPKTVYTIVGDYAKTTVEATGDGLTYQWYVKNEGESSYTKSSIKTATYSCKMSDATNGRYVKCKITDKYGNVVWANTVRLKMEELAITTQPTTQKVKAGKTATFKVVPNGKNVTYQWQYKTSSTGSWKNISAANSKTANYSLTAENRHNGYYYRCRVTDSAGNTVYTKTVRLFVLAIKTQPVSRTVEAGKTAKFTVSAIGNGLKYQWQYRTSSTGSWKNISAANSKTANYSLVAAARHNGYQYRCKITDSAGNVIYTNIVKLTVK